MTEESTKAELWENWVADTVLADIHNSDTPDPVPMLATDGEHSMTDAYDEYRLGHGRGEYLYLLYLLDDPVTDSSDVIPVYIGESSRIASRLLDHYRNLSDALPISDWDDDGSWGSYGKYDHMATVYERHESPLYAWLVDVETLESGPYRYPTYRQELEAKTVGLAHSHPRFTRTLANRDFVPNRVAYEMGTAGPDWVDTTHEKPTKEAKAARGHTQGASNGERKPALWHAWVDKTMRRDINDETTPDPIPLFETDADLVVGVKEDSSRRVLKRSERIDARIREAGQRCVTPDGVGDGPEGLLYVMYQLSATDGGGESIVPRYIGKAEAYGKQNEQSANFSEIASGSTSTRSFARWGDGQYWHIGELSDTIFGEDTKKLSWASELFHQGTHQLKAPVYLWIQPWDAATQPGPYGYPAYLAEVEALLIGLAYAASPSTLLNHREVPSEAPANSTDYAFEPVA